MKTLLAILIPLLLLVGLMIVIPKGSPDTPRVTKDSQITYQLGEKVKANPYGNWHDGEIVGITHEDEYIVKYCGNIGWFHHWGCEQMSLRRSQLAKTKEAGL